MDHAPLKPSPVPCYQGLQRMDNRPIELRVLHVSRWLVSTKVAAFVDYMCATFPHCTLVEPPVTGLLPVRPYVEAEPR